MQVNNHVKQMTMKPITVQANGHVGVVSGFGPERIQDPGSVIQDPGSVIQDPASRILAP